MEKVDTALQTRSSEMNFKRQGAQEVLELNEAAVQAQELMREANAPLNTISIKAAQALLLDKFFAVSFPSPKPFEGSL